MWLGVLIVAIVVFLWVIMGSVIGLSFGGWSLSRKLDRHQKHREKEAREKLREWKR